MQNSEKSAAPSSKRKRRRGNSKHPAILMLQMLLVLGFMGIFAAGGVVTGYVAALVKDEPVRGYEEIHKKIFSNYLTGFAYFNDGSLIGQLRAEEDRRLVKKSEVSPYLINAIIATEDKHFYEHHGVVFQSTLRGAIQDLTNQAVVTGGSTLTQQLIKNTILSDEVSHERKAKEIFNALRIERMFAKDQILEAYMNEIYFGKNANGSNIYGVQAAAKGIFNKDAKDLTLAEAAYIAGMPQSPVAYSPFTSEGYKRGKERQKIVLDRMLENSYITSEQYEQAFSVNLKALLAKPAKLAYASHPFLMMEIEERAAKALLDQQLQQEGRDKSAISRGEYRQLIEEKRREILRNGYHIHTTINKNVNQIMEDIASDPGNFSKNISYSIRRQNGKRERVENALEEVGSMLIQNKTGAILGMMGGRDFNVEQTNHATVPRQPGSSMKPLAAYAPAFELGYLQPGTPIDDSPLLLSDGVKGSHLPANHDRRYHGMISSREALRMSWNVPAIKAYMKVGIPTALEYVKKMGVTTLVDSDNHAATGVIGGLAYGLTAEEITNAYATFANHGSFIDAYLIEKIVDSQGKLIYQHEVQPIPVFSEQTAYLITDMMRTVVNAGTGSHVRRYVPRSIDIAGKTGTTNSSNDLWFVGYTPELSMGVWIGYDEPYPTRDPNRAMKIWGKVMKKVLDTESHLSPRNVEFVRPNGITSVTVDSKSGLLPSRLSKEANHLLTDIFNTQWVPTKVDDTHQRVKVVDIGEERYRAKEGTPDDFVTEAILFKSLDSLTVSAADVAEKNKRVGRRPLDWKERVPEKEDPRTDQPGTPSPPGHVALKRAGNQVTLTWTGSGEGDVIGYRLYRGDSSSSFSKVATIKNPGTTSFVDTWNSAAAVGYYITAVDIAGNESAPSAVSSDGNVIPIIPDSAGGTGTNQTENPDSEASNSTGQTNQKPANSLPKTPAKFAVKKAAGGYRLEWKPNASEDQVIAYNIYFSSDPANGFQLIDTITDNTYLHKNSEKAGWYYVTAVNSYGESRQSDNINIESLR